jgi:o-succinylbenzoate---CoA ligase
MKGLPHPLAAAARARPDHVLLRAAGVELRAADWVARVARVAGGLRERGLRPGARVVIPATVTVEFATLLHAATWAGLVACPIDPGLSLDHQGAVARRLRARAVLGPAATPQGEPLAEPAFRDSQPAWIVLSSGSTGAPKPAVLTHGQLLLSAMGSAMRLGHLPDDCWLCCLPLHHVGGLSILWRTAWLGTTAILHPRFSAAAVAQALDAGEASLVSLVPTMLGDVLDARSLAPFPAGLRAVLLGGAAAPAELLERCQSLSVPVARTWGMSEAGSQVATAFPGDLSPLLPPLAFVQIGEEEGALTLSGPLAPGGHLRTRDRGRLVGGAVEPLGRLDDTILRGGENIDPRAIEALLLRHPLVADAAVVGAPDARLGAVPVAYVVLRGDADAASLAAWCAAALPASQVPVRFEVRDSLPRSALGKLQVSGLYNSQ